MPDEMTSSRGGGRKNGSAVDGIDSLKSSKALQQRVAVDHGAIYLVPSISRKWAPSERSAGGSGAINLCRASACSARRESTVISTLSQRNLSAAGKAEIGSKIRKDAT
jgi:hypothetical protein